MYQFLGYKLLPWVETALRDIYGTIEIDTGLRQYREAFISTAKKQGKSFFLGGMPVYHLDQEEEPMARAVGGATTRKQASEIFESAATLINANPELKRRFKVTPSSKTITHLRTLTNYEVLSADGDKNDGLRRSLGLIDELHRFKSEREEGMLDAVYRGSRGRPQPLLVKITTAGDPTSSQIWLQEYNYAKQVQAGTISNPRYYVAIHEADPEKLKADPEYWKSKEARLAACPSHEDFGGFVKDEELREDLEKAILIPSEKAKYWRFTLNASIDGDEKYIKGDEWNVCATEQRTMTGRECSIGVDLSFGDDLTAMVCLFRDENDTYDVLPFFFMAEDRVPEIAQRLGPMGATFKQWVREGFIETNPGNVVDYTAIEKKIIWADEVFSVREINPDPFNFQKLAQQIEPLGMKVVSVPQSYGKLSPPTKHLREKVLEGKVRHGGHPVLAWNIACCTTVQNFDGDIKLKKIKRNIESVRIDGAAALVNAMSSAMLYESAFSSPAGLELSW